MNQEEVRKVLNILKVNYPQSFANMGPESRQALLNLWEMSFKNMPYQLVNMAVTAIIQDSDREWAPNIGQINTKIKTMLTQDSETEAVDAWYEMLDFIHKYGQEEYHEHYEKLSPRIRKLIKVPDLREIANNNSADNEQFEKPRFIGQYKRIKESDECDAISTGRLSKIISQERMAELGLNDQMMIGVEMRNSSACSEEKER